MFAQQVRWISLAWDVMKGKYSCSYRESCAVEGQCIVSLLQFTMWDRCRVDYSLIIPEHV